MTRKYANLTVVTLHQEILISDRLRGAVLLFILNGEARVRPRYLTHSPEHRATRRPDLLILAGWVNHGPFGMKIFGRTKRWLHLPAYLGAGGPRPNGRAGGEPPGGHETMPWGQV